MSPRPVSARACSPVGRSPALQPPPREVRSGRRPAAVRSWRRRRARGRRSRARARPGARAPASWSAESATGSSVSARVALGELEQRPSHRGRSDACCGLSSTAWASRLRNRSSWRVWRSRPSSSGSSPDRRASTIATATPSSRRAPKRRAERDGSSSRWTSSTTTRTGRPVDRRSRTPRTATATDRPVDAGALVETERPAQCLRLGSGQRVELAPRWGAARPRARRTGGPPSARVPAVLSTIMCRRCSSASSSRSIVLPIPASPVRSERASLAASRAFGEGAERRPLRLPPYEHAASLGESQRNRRATSLQSPVPTAQPTGVSCDGALSPRAG